jgi:hypothetical protein
MFRKKHTLMTGYAVYITKVYGWLQEGVQGSQQELFQEPCNLFIKK